MSRYSVNTMTGSSTRESQRRRRPALLSDRAACRAASVTAASHRLSRRTSARPGAARSSSSTPSFRGSSSASGRSSCRSAGAAAATQERQPALRRDSEGSGARERALPKHDRRELRACVAAGARLQPDPACVALQEIVHPAFGRCRLDPQEDASSSNAALHFGTRASEEDDRRLGVVEGADSAECRECGWISSIRRGGQENGSPRPRGDGMRRGAAIARA